MKSLIIDNYDSYTYNLFQLIGKVSGIEPLVIKNDEMTYDEILNNNFNLRAIQSNCSGHTKTSQGYIWRYKSEESVA